MIRCTRIYCSGVSKLALLMEYDLLAFLDLDGPALWRSTAIVTSVVTTTVVSSTVLPGSNLIDGHERPSSVPPIVSPHLLAGGYGASEPMSESQLDQFQVL